MGAVRALLGGAARRAYSHSLGPPRRLLTPVNVLVAANVAVFAAWMAASDNPAVRRFVDRHLLLSNSRVQASWAPYLGHMFMHADLLHLASNMVALKTFGDGVYAAFGGRTFLALYFTAGLVGGAAQLAYHTHVPHSNLPAAPAVKWDNVAVGASGAIAGITALFGAAFPRSTVVLFVVPVPSVAFMAGFLAWSAYCAVTGADSTWAHAAHMGGAATGLAAAGIIAARAMLRR